MRLTTVLSVGALIAGSVMTAQAVVAPQPQASAAAQQQVNSTMGIISGTVVDDQGEPLIGVSVQIVGQQGGYITDVNGRFEFRTRNSRETLRLSYISYKSQTVTFVAGRPQRIVLENDSQTLEGVVVTGFTKKDKKSFTGSQTTVSSKDLLSMGTKNVLQSLEAFVPGLQVVTANDLGSNPNARPELNLRGRATFSGAANLPLFVVDGAIVDVNYIYDMDMNTIESVTVLKDASASALYGSKAAAGVIVITTKPISQGNIRINYNGTLRLSVPDLSGYSLLSPEEKLRYEELAGIYTDRSGGESQWRLDRERDAVLRKVRQGTNTNWLAKPLRTGVSQSHSLNAEGGDTFVRYGLTLRYSNDDGVMMQSARERISGSFKLSYNKPNRVFISNNLTVNKIASEDPNYGSFSEFSRQNPYNSPYDEFGELIPRFTPTQFNPLYEASLSSFSNSNSLDLLNTTTLQVWAGKFRIDGDFSFNTGLGMRRRFRSPLAGEFAGRPIAERGSLTEMQDRSIGFLGKLMVSYNNTFFDKLYVTSMVGSSLEGTTTDNSSFTTQGFYSDQLGHPRYGLSFASGSRPSGSEAQARGAGFFFNGNAIYDNRYSFDVVYRYEGSSRFGRNQRFAPFWSLGAGWNVHNEKFFKGNKDVQMLKLRTSIGYLGNVSFEPYQALTTYDFNRGLNYMVGAGAVPLAIGNPDLKWERTLNMNAGVDLTLFKSRWDLTLDVYRKLTDNLLLDVSKASSVGTPNGTAKENVGEIENRGIEFQTRVVPIQTKDWQWSISLNYSYNNNKVRKISDALRAINEQNSSQDSLNRTTTPLPLYEEGESLTALKVVPSAGIDPATGREVYIKRDGSYTFDYDPNDRRVFGDTAPLGYGTLSSYVFWKGWSLNASFGYSFGAVVYNGTLATRVEGANPAYNADKRVFNDRWRQVGDVARYRNIAETSSPYQTSRFVQREHFLTLRALSVGYETDAAWVKKLLMRRARIELLANDLFYLSSVKRERGLDYPFARSVEMSLRLSF